MQLPGVQDAAAGALLGFFASLGGAVGRLRLGAEDPVMQVWEEARGKLKGDMAELGEQAIKLYEEVQARIARRRAESKDGAALTEAERVAGETATGLIKLAERWCQIEEGADKTARPRLEARLEALEAKIKASGDAVIKAEYSAAAAVVRDQLQGFAKIDVARERLVARMHRSLASLERVSLKLLQLSTSDAQDASLGLRPELERLDEMSDDLSWKTLSVDELCNMTADEAPSKAEGAPALVVMPAPVEAEVKEVVEEKQTA
jgi:hypothetical protein